MRSFDNLCNRATELITTASKQSFKRSKAIILSSEDIFFNLYQIKLQMNKERILISFFSTIFSSSVKLFPFSFSFS